MSLERLVSYSDTVEDIKIEYMFEPVSDILSEKVGDLLIVAYITHDSDCSNPMKDNDAEGTLYTKPPRMAMDGSITDDSDWGEHLGLTEYGEPNLELGAVKDRARELMRATIAHDQDFIDWCLEEFEEFSSIEDCFDTIDFDCHWDIPTWLQMLYDHFLEPAWALLYEEGELGTHLAVPVNYCPNNHGPGTASAYTASIDNCDAVWVPDQHCINNMTFLNEHTYLEKLAVAGGYAESILDNYIDWCNGECYGCIVEVFDATGEQVHEDSCWSFIGMDHAKQSLKEDYFKPAVMYAQTLYEDREYHRKEAIRTQDGRQLELEGI
jgi:hypothetical protein